MDNRDPLIKSGRPRLEVDFALVLHLRDDEHMGWTRGAEEYRERTGHWVSRDTFKRRYNEAKDTPKSWLEEFREELERVLKERWKTQ